MHALFSDVSNFTEWLFNIGSCWKAMRHFVCQKLFGTLPQNTSSPLILSMERHWTRWSRLIRRLETWYAQVFLYCLWDIVSKFMLC